MNSKISGGVKISVETFYQSEYSNPINSEFMFAYKNLQDGLISLIFVT